MNKSPFEIRLDVLKMAQEMLDAERRSQEKYFEQKVDLLKSSNVQPEVIANFITSTEPPKAYTEQDLLTRSSNLYAFVDNKTRT
jgi:hypothetical protein